MSQTLSLPVHLFLFYLSPLPLTQAQRLPKLINLKGIQNLLEMVIGGLYDFIHGITHDKKQTRLIAPVAMSLFFFIIFNNWFGLLPGVGTIGVTEEKHAAIVQSVNAVEEGVEANHSEDVMHMEKDTHTEGDEHYAEGAGHTSEAGHDDGHHGPVFIPIFRPGTADLNTTIALALIAVVGTQIVGVKFLGFSYFSKFFNLRGIDSFVGILEIISEISKIISFAFRLFGNIFAGEVLLAVIYALTAGALSLPIIPFLGLEIFVGFIQALVFMLLTVVFMSLATHAHSGDDH